MTPAFRRAALAYTLAYRGHAREAAETWTRDMEGTSVLLADLVVIGAFPTDRARTVFDGWLQAGSLYSSLHGLPLWSSP